MKHTDKQIRRARRVRASISANLGLPRLTVHRSNRYIWAQIIDDKHGKTLVSAGTKLIPTKGTKTEKATLLGEKIAALAKEKKIEKIRFDRGAYRYHGRVKAVATGARNGGLQF